MHDLDQLDRTDRDAEVVAVTRRTVAATRVVAAAAIGLTLTASAVDLRIALLPVAFVLGWLNLVGL